MENNVIIYMGILILMLSMHAIRAKNLAVVFLIQLLIKDKPSLPGAAIDIAIRVLLLKYTILRLLFPKK
jgi:hypothetical protein